jgi:hypothetical protein
MSGKLFIEQREKEGDYVIRRPGADRASGREDTQAEAIERAREIDPQAAILVEPAQLSMAPTLWISP